MSQVLLDCSRLWESSRCSAGSWDFGGSRWRRTEGSWLQTSCLNLPVLGILLARETKSRTGTEVTRIKFLRFRDFSALGVELRVYAPQMNMQVERVSCKIAIPCMGFGLRVASGGLEGSRSEFMQNQLQQIRFQLGLFRRNCIPCVGCSSWCEVPETWDKPGISIGILYL